MIDVVGSHSVSTFLSWSIHFKYVFLFDILYTDADDLSYLLGVNSQPINYIILYGRIIRLHYTRYGSCNDPVV